MSWIVTASGKRVDPLNISPADIEIGDICHALGNICRFTGHCSRFYSVAEHSVRMVDWCFKDAEPLERLAALLHDAAEAYIGDIAKPLKSRVVFTRTPAAERSTRKIVLPPATRTAIGLTDLVEEEILNAVYERLGIRRGGVRFIDLKLADRAMLRIEAQALMPDYGLGWTCFDGMEPMTDEEIQRAREIRRDTGSADDWPRWMAAKLDEILGQLDTVRGEKRRRLATGG